VIQAAEAVASGQADVCLAIGALMDLSHWECRALRSMGAMGSDRHAEDPALACRPFDKSRDGFIYGECCAVLAIESLQSARRRGARIHAHITGWSTVLDGNRNPDPSAAGEARALNKALSHAGLTARDLDYLNPHGTGSIVGDRIELEAIRACGLTHAKINTTKSLTGHGLSAAGAIEIAGILAQMRANQLHPSRNLDEPLDPDLNWVRGRAESHRMRHALSLSCGFGGINSAICLSRADAV
jgi:malonyl-ACP decarboxylase